MSRADGLTVETSWDGHGQVIKRRVVRIDDRVDEAFLSRWFATRSEIIRLHREIGIGPEFDPPAPVVPLKAGTAATDPDPAVRGSG